MDDTRATFFFKDITMKVLSLSTIACVKLRGICGFDRTEQILCPIPSCDRLGFALEYTAG